ncbi:hypothetical protein AB4491_02420, partial [Vibrio sp. 10N.261.45.A7]
MINKKHQALAISSIALLVAGCSPSSDTPSVSKINDYQGTASITQGKATTVESNLFECENGRSRVAGGGEITDSEGK